MFVWEREIYINLLMDHIQNSETQQQANGNPFEMFRQ